MEYLLKSALISIVIYSFYRIFLQQETFFQSIRIYFMMGIITSLLLPLLIIPQYIEVQSIQVPEIVENIKVKEIIPQTELLVQPMLNKESIDWFAWLSLLYGIGIVVLVVKFMIDLVSLIYLMYTSKRIKKGKYIFVEIDKEVSPFSFFNFIVYNKDHFDERELKDIISHEKVHVQQKHSIDLLLMQIFVIIQWFNPFVWFYKKDMQQNLEYIADKSAQEKSETNQKYQYLLLKTSISTNPFALSNNFFNSHLKKRIIMLQKSQTKRLNLLKYILLVPLIALFLYSFNIEEVVRVKESKAVSNLYNVAKNVIVIDVAHGGIDAGETIENISEKDIVLAISKKIKSLYKGNAIIEFTRETDELVSLNDRVKKINNINPSLMISLHVNTANNKDDEGLMAFVSKNNRTFEVSKIAAHKLLNSITNDHLKNKGISKTNFIILRETKSPSVLLELGFLSNEKERNYLNSDRGQTEIAKSIIDYINGNNLFTGSINSNRIRFINPIHHDNVINISGFGKRINPFTKKAQFHQGVDIKAYKGTDVYATADGVIINADYNELKGNYIQIQHLDNYQTNYHHLGDIQVKVGEKVNAGDIISTVGNTGKSTGPHLHYEILKEGKAVDPKFYLNYNIVKKHGNKSKSRYKFSKKKEYDSFNVIIDSKTTDKELRAITLKFKKRNNVAINFDDVERNIKGEIIAIRIDGKFKNSSNSFSLSQDEPIGKVLIAFDKERDEIYIETIGFVEKNKTGYQIKTIKVDLDNMNKKSKIKYLVEEGDTYYSIARDNGISIEYLYKLNPDNKELTIGSYLFVNKQNSKFNLN